MKPVPLLDLKAQFDTLRDEMFEKIREVVETQAFILGPGVEAFENALQEFVGARFAIGCASGSDALILSLAALGIGPGDTVVTTPFSFFATASCAYRVGARPKFVDILPDTYNIDPDKIEEALDDSVKAILPVHLFGQCADMRPILAVADSRGIPVVEDAAQALSAGYRAGDGSSGTVRAGNIGTIGCFSFFPSKNLGAFGDGGAMTTSDEKLAGKLRSLRVHGGKQMYRHDYVGWNSRLDALQAAVLSVKLPRLDRWSGARAANAGRYNRMFVESGLVDSGDIVTPVRLERCDHIYNQYTLRVRDRDGLLDHLRECGIGHAVYYPVALHLQQCFRELGYREGDFPESEKAAREVVSLPVYPEMTFDQQERVVDAVTGFYLNS